MLRFPICLLAILFISASAAFAQQPTPREIVTEGCSLISPFHVMSVTTSQSETLQPLVWGSPRASSGHQHGLQGTLPVPGWLGNHGSGRVAIWDGHPGFFGAGADGRDDNDRLRRQLIDWLRDGGGNVAFARAHAEKPMGEVFSGMLWQHVSDNAEPHEIDAALTTELLEDVDLLVLGSSWERIAISEVDAIEDYVLNGGGLLVIGIGWAYSGYAADPDPDLYIPNLLGERFGWHVEFTTMSDPDTPSGEPGTPAFAILPLADYLPADIVVISGSPAELDNVARLAEARPQDIYIVEGQHIGISLPNEYWAQLDSASGLVALMDEMYRSHLALVGAANPPYGGDVIWYVPEDVDDAGWYMHAGNPIVYRHYAADEIVRQYNEEQRLGWGIVHELGHDFHISSCGNNMIPDGTGENWANVWSVWTNNTLGWPQHERYARDGNPYHDDPDFAQLSSDNWILLDCLDMIWQRYGWQGMQLFLTDVASRTTAGEKVTGNDARCQLLIEGMSHGYEVDFSDLFAYWGFTVSDETRDLLSKYPPSDIAIP